MMAAISNIRKFRVGTHEREREREREGEEERERERWMSISRHVPSSD